MILSVFDISTFLPVSVTLDFVNVTAMWLSGSRDIEACDVVKILYKAS